MLAPKLVRYNTRMEEKRRRTAFQFGLVCYFYLLHSRDPVLCLSAKVCFAY